jgi:hypothetical protein
MGVMADLSATRIEPLAPGAEMDKRSPSDGSPRKHPAPEKEEKPLPTPSIDAGDPVEEIHQIDELA